MCQFYGEDAPPSAFYLILAELYLHFETQYFSLSPQHQDDKPVICHVFLAVKQAFSFLFMKISQNTAKSDSAIQRTSIPMQIFYISDCISVLLNIFMDWRPQETTNKNLTKRATAVNRVWCIDYKPWKMLRLPAYCILFHGLKIEQYPVLCKVYVSVGEKKQHSFLPYAFYSKIY